MPCTWSAPIARQAAAAEGAAKPQRGVSSPRRLPRVEALPPCSDRGAGGCCRHRAVPEATARERSVDAAAKVCSCWLCVSTLPCLHRAGFSEILAILPSVRRLMMLANACFRNMRAKGKVPLHQLQSNHASLVRFFTLGGCWIPFQQARSNSLKSNTKIRYNPIPFSLLD